MNQIIRIAVAVFALGFAATAAQAAPNDEGGKPHAACKGDRDGKAGNGEHRGRRGHHLGKRVDLNQVTQQDLSTAGLTSDQIQKFEAAKPFTHRGQLRKLGILERGQFRKVAFAYLKRTGQLPLRVPAAGEPAPSQ